MMTKTLNSHRAAWSVRAVYASVAPGAAARAKLPGQGARAAPATPREEAERGARACGGARPATHISGARRFGRSAHESSQILCPLAARPGPCDSR
jgi:hypothetical protein